MHKYNMYDIVCINMVRIGSYISKIETNCRVGINRTSAPFGLAN